jgi:hypothetical protein
VHAGAEELAALFATPRLLALPLSQAIFEVQEAVDDP